MKKLISIALSIAMVMSVCSASIYAFAPTDFHNPKCIDVRKLGVDTDYITRKNKVCGCKTCSVDAVMYNKLDDYLTDLENLFESILKEKNYIENAVKRMNIEDILTSISNDIKVENYKNRNFLLVSTNYDPNSPSSTASFSKKDDITYINNYDEAYFKEINDRIKNILGKVEKRNKLLEDSPIIFNESSPAEKFVKMLVSYLVFGSAVILTAVYGQPIFNKISEFFKNKPNDAKELIGTIKKLPEAGQDIIKKKILKYFDKEIEINEENLKKLPNKVIKELLKEVKELEEQSNEKTNIHNTKHSNCNIRM